MGILLISLLIIALCSLLISRAVYKRQVKNNYSSPYLTSTLVFILTFALLAGGIFLLFVYSFGFSRH